MILLKINFIVVFVLLAQNCIAQIWVQGIVLDNKDNPIQHATIQIRQKTTDKLLQVTTTGSLGTFSYELSATASDTSVYKIIVSHISYSVSTVEVNVGTWKLGLKKIYVLGGKQAVLQEVVVTSVPIRIHDDTTTYRAKAFADGTEKTLEDIAKKLPGLTVGEDGSMTFKGKRLTNVFIEGEDLLSNKTKLLSKNFPADLIEQVQLIENYNDNMLLKGFDQGDRTVMNLKLNNRKLKVAFGELAATIGLRERQEYNAILFSLLNTTKLATIAKYNNIGKDNMQSTGLTIDSDELVQKISNFDYGYLGRVPDNTIKPFIGSLPLPTQRWFFNNQLTISQQLNFKISKKNMLKVLTSYQADHADITNTRESVFFQQNNNFQSHDTSQRLFSPKLLEIKIWSDIPIAPNKQGRLIVHFKADNSRWNIHQAMNQFNQWFTNAGNLTNAIKTGYILYDHTYRKNENTIQLGNTYFSIKSIPQQYIILSNSFGNSVPGTNNYNQAIQKNELQEYILGHQLQYIQKKRGVVNAPYLNVQYEKTVRNNSLLFTNGTHELQYIPGMQSDKNGLGKLMIGFKKTRRLQKTKMIYEVEAGVFHWQNEAANTTSSRTGFLGKLATQIQQKFSDPLSASVSASMERSYNNNHLLNDSFLLIGNNELMRYSTTDLLATKFSLNYNLFYRSPRLLLVSVHGSHFFQPKGFVGSNSFSSAINFINHEFVDKPSSTSFLSVSIKNPMVKLQSRVELISNLLFQKHPFYKSRNNYSNFQSLSVNTEMRYVTAFQSKWNADFSFKHMFSSSYRSDENTVSNKFQNISVIYASRLFYKYYAANTFSVLGSHYHLNMNNTPLKLYFVDCEFTYFYEKMKLQFEINIRNVLDEKMYNQFFITPLFQNNTSYKLYGRSIDFTVKFKL